MHCACALMCVYSLTGAWWSPGKEGGSGCCRGSCSGRRRASFNNSTRFLSCPLQSKISLFAKFLHFSNGFPRLTHTNIALPKPEIIAQYFCQDQTGVRTAQYVGWHKKKQITHVTLFFIIFTWLTAPSATALLVKIPPLTVCTKRFFRWRFTEAEQLYLRSDVIWMHSKP